ncbi:replication factor C large subunit [Natronomonas pharaonis DSM 2160]|uniref:Replication factor C large subunit n=1 Tax=Natronomonas pharaonis (strain ATCC 35678 / DSM 2160 / CIP 103997 / JCM 8858 / NBRC 14720 / NCIMB 2260 / Gabara) TaxID=348780 RepID=RFCL_NATPD|nr:replication factor C large subunit [Natronomonas pharaonis]Q3ISA5.1 RecName: Full=Replication factor C large subunit; Short=RFC large subunit; AltName: Full=Clamp loader large subunit [Natronomonas pharaonis DSM 2160]CAI48982.1 replication factor C large subunit [Natronomonas pharaonis DSM 2160]
MSDWTEAYRPTTLSEVRGNNKARDAFEEWAKAWEDHREAVILHGSPGVGKTSAAHALANDMGWPVLEMNASDARTKDEIERFAGRAASNATLGGGRQLIILDEADNLHQHKDRGGAAAMTRLVKDATQPVVLIANDYYEMSSGLRSACRDVEFRDVSARSIVPVLRDICRQENVEFDEDVLQEIAEANRGDLRGAVKDLQARERDGEIKPEGSEGSRDRTEDIFAFLDAVLKEESAEEALQTAYAVDETPDNLLQWIEDKVPKVYEGDELADAYEHLADADVWLGRVRATQNYSYWRYATDNVAAGVAAVRQEDRGGWTRYGGAPYRSSRDSTRDYIATRIAESAGVSTATARREILPYLSAMTHHCNNRELTVRMTARYELDAEHVAFITGSGKTTNKVQGIVEDAETRRETAAVDHGGGIFAPAVDDAQSDTESDDDDDGDTLAAFGADEPKEESVNREQSDGTADAEESDDGQAGLSDFM